MEWKPAHDHIRGRITVDSIDAFGDREKQLRVQRRIGRGVHRHQGDGAPICGYPNRRQRRRIAAEGDCNRKLFFETDDGLTGIIQGKFSAIVAFLGGPIPCPELCAVP